MAINVKPYYQKEKGEKARLYSNQGPLTRAVSPLSTSLLLSIYSLANISICFL
jgi:hypothetical protein